MADIHDLPLALTTDDRVHDLDRNCWCHPSVIELLSGEELIVHDEEPF